MSWAPTPEDLELDFSSVGEATPVMHPASELPVSGNALKCYTCDKYIVDQNGNSLGVFKETMRSDAKTGKILARYAIGLCQACDWIWRGRRQS
jgi:hypothetical protein